MKRKRIQLGLIHMAVAMTAVPADSLLNRIMIKELALSATLVAVLVTLPFLFSPIQVWIGSFADLNPILGRRRTPYIVIGLFLSAVGIAIAPMGTFLFETSTIGGIGVSLLGFGLWGMGFNFATVSYFSLASELSDEKGSSQTVSTMYFIMLLGVIATGITASRLVQPYSPQVVTNAIWIISSLALFFGLLGIVGLEPRAFAPLKKEVQIPLKIMVKRVSSNRQARLFFGYLILLLTAVLGQDLLLEPYAAEAFNMSVSTTTRLTSIYGVCFLITLTITGLLEKRTNKRTVAKIGSWGAIAAFVLLIMGGILQNVPLFYGGVVLLGFAIGLATVANHSLMFDMTTAQNVGLFIGAWGMAVAFARLIGSLLSGIVRDVLAQVITNPTVPYMIAFGLNIAFLLISLVLLRQLNVMRFRVEAEVKRPLTHLIKQSDQSIN